MSYSPTAFSGKIILTGSTSGTFEQFASAVTTPYSIIWPAAQGGANTYLTNNSGTLNWSTIPTPLVFIDSIVDSGGTVTLVNDSAVPGDSMYYGTNSSGVRGYYSFPFTFADSLVNTSGTITLVNDSASPGDSMYYGTNGSGILGYYSIPITGANQYLSNLLSPTGVNQTLNLNAASSLLFQAMDLTYYYGFTGPSTSGASAVTWALPNADGTPGQFLSTNGSATLSWSTPTSGITALTGDVTASGSGSVVATLTATTNSTITTLSGLTLPYSQLTGTPTFANQSLSNLTSPTAINQSLLFNADNTYTIGASGNALNNVETYTVSSAGSLGLNANTGLSPLNIMASVINLTTGFGGPYPHMQFFDTYGNNYGYVGGDGGSPTGYMTVSSGPNAGHLQLITPDVTGSTNGSDIIIQSGTTVNGNSGNVTIGAGTVSGSGTRGSNILLGNTYIESGAGIPWGILAYDGILGVNVSAGFPGNSGNPGGNLNLFTSNYTFGVNAGNGSGNVNIAAGSSNGAGSGAVTLTGANNSASSPGGNVILTPGTGSVPGFIRLNDLSGTITASQVWTASDSNGDGRWATIPNFAGALDGSGSVITWTSVANAMTGSNGSITKSGGTPNNWGDSGAFSTTSFTSSGIFYITFPTTNTAAIAGLSATNTGNSNTDVQFGILTSGTVWQVMESGGGVLATGSFIGTDLFSIQLSGGVITYYQNGSLIYTSLGTPSSTLFAKVAMYNNGDSVTTAAFNGAAGMNGTTGLVPQPVNGDEFHFLRGDGTWADPIYSMQTTLTATGTAICSQPFRDASYKKVVVYLNAYTDTGTQTYTYPTAFVHTPYVYGLTAGVAGATATTTSVTFNVTAQTGFVFIEGY